MMDENDNSNESIFSLLPQNNCFLRMNYLLIAIDDRQTQEATLSIEKYAVSIFAKATENREKY